MEIMLISPNLSTEERYGKALGKVGPATEPLGLAYLAASLRGGGHKVEIIDAAPMKMNLNDIKARIYKNNYDLVGISFLTPMYGQTKETIKAVKEANPNLKIVVGGPHFTIMPLETMRDNPKIDFGISGEGEITIVELCGAIENNREFKNIKGLAYRQGNEVKINQPREFVKDLDSLPLPARDLLDMQLYRPAPTYYKKLPSYVIFTSRGCPFRCVYCSKVSGRLYRHHSAERVLREMNILNKQYNAKEIIFRDDTFTVDREFVIDLCSAIIRQRLHKKVKWTCMTRVNLVDFQLLRLMRKAGCWSIHYGIESGSQRLLNLIKKDITLEQAKEAIKWTRKAGIETKTFFMLGLPTETKEESLQTIKFTKELDPDWIQCTITIPYPGTELYELAKADGTLKSVDWSNYQTWAGWSNKELVFYPKDRDPEELKELQKMALREFYLRPKIMFRQLKQLRSWSMLKMYVLGAYALIKSKLKF